MGDNFTKNSRPFYPQLSPHNREIRLLHLQPGHEASKLQCRLSVASLEAKPLYETLSYTWGNLNNTSSIIVDEHDVLIPRNLEEALRRLRLDDTERVLWADAICIDQSQTAERNQQVALMADVYRKCTRCLIWLGQTGLETDYLDSLSELLTALSKKHHFDQPDAPRINPMLGRPRIPLMYVNGVAWWNRMWVVQEVILAPQSLVLYGSFEMTFSDLVNAVEFVNEHDMRAAWYASSRKTDEFCGCLDHVKVTFVWAELLALRDQVYRLLEVTNLETETNGSQSMSLPGAPTNLPDLINVLLGVRHRACTDPRDKIFAVLSLVQDWGSWTPIKADYSKDTLTVYTEFATQMIHSEYGPRTLLLAQRLDPPSRALEALPSWVPDWTKSGTGYEKYLLAVDAETPRSSQPALILGSTLTLQHVLSTAKIIRASNMGSPPSRSDGHISASTYEDWRKFTGSLEMWREFAGVGNSLSLGGVLTRCLSSPEHTEETEPRVESGSYERLMTDIKRSDDTVDFMPNVQDYFAVILEYQEDLRRMEPDEEAFYRTLIHDAYPLSLKLPEHHKEGLCILRILLIFLSDCVDPDRLLTRLNSMVLTKMSETLEMLQTFQKRLFWTDNGNLGIAPEGILAGDEIFFFDGVKTPFVLRAVGMRMVEGQGSQNCYELVGNCYVDGLRRDELDWKRARMIYLQ